MSEVKLGVEVRDRVSQFKGVVTQKIEQISGNVMYSVQPVSKKGEYPDAYDIDGHLLEVIGVGVSKLLPEVDDSVTIKLGEAVQDVVTGFKGMAVSKVTFQNGCVHFVVAGKVSKDGKELLSFSVNHKRLKKTGPGVTGRYAKITKARDKSPGAKAPGGPSTRSNSIRTI